MADDPIVHVEPLKPWMRRGLFAAVVFFHVGGGWALTLIHPDPIVIGDAAPMAVSFITEQQTPPQEQPPEPVPEPPQLESMIQPPPPDMPPPAFPVPPPPPPKPVVKPTPPKPVERATPAPAAPVASAPAINVAPKTVSASQVGYLNAPQPVYPTRSRRSGETGTVMIRVLIDLSGTPTNVSIQTSSGHQALDESALSAVKAARFRPYAEGGVPQTVWVLVPINFVLQ